MQNEIFTAMQSAGKNLLNALNPEKNFIPYWRMEINEDLTAEFQEWWPQHNLGRWWDAMLRLEAVGGVTIPAKIEAAMMYNLERFFDNPDHLCLQPLDYAEEPYPLELHSLRESLLALHALIKYRGSRWAAEKGHRMLETIQKIYVGDSRAQWDLTRLDYAKHCDVAMGRHFDAVGSNGRLLEALIWYYQATDDELAMRLARRIAAYHLQNTTTEDGSINFAVEPDHTHSFLNTLQGMLLYGKETGSRAYIERVARVYARTVRKQIVKESGFTAHDLGTDANGETSSGSDAAQLAMWLTDEGYLEFADDAERIVRARLLPAQLMEKPTLIPAGKEERDCCRDLSRRCVGGFSMHKYPHAGKINTTDVTAHCLHALTDAYWHIVSHKGKNTFVMLHFDYESDEIGIRSEREDAAKLTVRMRKPSPLFVRIPRWTDAESVAVSVNGRAIPLEMHSCFAYIGTQPAGSVVDVRYSLPEKEINETTDGVAYSIAWRGDDVTGISPNIGFLPFYRTIQSRSAR